MKQAPEKTFPICEGDTIYLCLWDKASTYWQVENVKPEEPWDYYTILEVKTASVRDISFRNRGVLTRELKQE